MLGKIAKSKSKTFQACCFCFLFGVVLGSLGYTIGWQGSAMAALLCMAFFQNSGARIITILICCVMLGLWRVDAQRPNAGHISQFNGQEVQLQAVVVKEPDVRIEDVRYVLAVEQPGHGRVLLKQRKYPRLERGTHLEVRCMLEAPEAFNGFRYDQYLANQGIWSLCRYPKIEGVHQSMDRHVLLKIKHGIAAQITTLWHEPYAGFMAGLLYGYRGGLGTLDTAFAQTGLTHIVAISGYNITIISSLFFGLLTRLWLPRRYSVAVVLCAIAAFVLFVGAEASVVRAGIMGGLVVLARQLGRPQRAGGILLLAAVLMSLYRPLSLLWDVGFQLSFLATIGLIYLEPHMRAKLMWIPERFALQESASSTLAAIVVTQPLVLYQFGRISLVAPVVNLLVLWCIPLIMATGFAATLVSFCSLAVSRVIAFLPLALMSYVSFIAQQAAVHPAASVDLPISCAAMLIMYGGLYLLYKQHK